MATLLALDLGTKTGWALGRSLDKDGYIDGGTKNLGKEPGVGQAFCDWLHYLIHIDNTMDVVYEKVYAHKGVLAAHRYGGFESMLRMVCHGYTDIKISSYTPTQIKKYLTGSGRASKQDMIRYCSYLPWGIKPVDDNHADALGLLFTALTDKRFKETCQPSGETNGK